MDKDNPIIVIGSGFAGGISALRLVEAGFKVILLERGPWRDTDAVREARIEKPAPLPKGRNFYTHLLRRFNKVGLPGGGFTLNKRGVYEIFSGENIDVACSSHVGGCSHVYGALHMRPQDPAYWDGHNEKITSQYMEKYYISVLKDMGSKSVDVSGQGLNLFADRFRDNPAFITDERSMDMAMGLKGPLESFDSETISSIGLLGASSGLKRTADEMYIIPALEKGLIVKDMCEVLHIQRQDQGSKTSYHVEFFDHLKKRKNRLVASRVIMAAGTMNTLKILLASRAEAKRLDGMPLLGHKFGGNGDYSAYWNHGNKSGDMSEGLPTRGKISLSDEKLWTSSRPWPSIVEGGLPYSKDLPWLPFLKKKIRQGSLIAAMGQDNMDGKISYDRGGLRIDYRPEDSQIYHDIRQAFDLIEKLSGHKITHFPKISTVHPTGGACLGSSDRHGVVDDGGQVFGHPGLYVADGAALPAALGAPPSISIAAWANNVADKIISI
ncbi:MAG: hypothetical protein COB36_14965 [Alphaproteobacteria bacterium]|nr:MAG: hypothetical protein COB36_14965 [Alphaproteobacteria bacterium]